MQFAGAMLMAVTVTAAAFVAYNTPNRYLRSLRWFVVPLLMWGAFAIGWDTAVDQAIGAARHNSVDAESAVQAIKIGLWWATGAPTVAATYMLGLVLLPSLGVVKSEAHPRSVKRGEDGPRC